MPRRRDRGSRTRAHALALPNRYIPAAITLPITAIVAFTKKVPVWAPLLVQRQHSVATSTALEICRDLGGDIQFEASSSWLGKDVKIKCGATVREEVVCDPAAVAASV